MAFNIGAAFGGFATTLAERVKEDEKRVDLLTDRALDLHTRLKLEADKENKTNLKNAEELINALGITGLDLETRAAIASGGAASVEHTLKQFDVATEKGVDFSTVYNVSAPTPGTEQFTSKDWASQITTFVDTPEIATGVLGESKTIFGADPQQVFERKLKTVLPEDVDKAIGQKFKPAALNIDLSSLSSQSKLYTNSEAALVGTTQLILEEKAKPEPDVNLITRLEGELVAYLKLDNSKGSGDLIKKEIDATGFQIAELDAIPEADRPADWQTNRDRLQATLDTMLDMNNYIIDAKSTPADKFATHTALLTSIDTELLTATGDRKTELLAQRTSVFNQIIADKKALSEAEGLSSKSYTIFSDESITKIFDAAMSNSMPDIVEVGLQGQITTKLKGNEARYIIGSFDAINFVEKSYGQLEDSLLSNVIEQRRVQTNNMLEAYKSKKLSQYYQNQQLETPKDSIEGFYSEPDAATAAEEAAKGKYKVGDVVRTKDPNDPTKYISYMWTGVTFI